LRTEPLLRFPIGRDTFIRGFRPGAILCVALLATSLSLIAGSAAGGAAPVAETTPPETTIHFGPEGPTFATRPVFGYESNDPSASFECSLDSGPFEPCGPATYESLEGRKGKLADGPHTFAVRAVNEAGITDPTPAVASFTVDTHPPTATILTRPRHFLRDTTPTFAIEVSGEVKFRCQIIGKGVRIKVPSCDGPHHFTSPRPLPEGSYEFILVAVDEAVNETEDQVEFQIRTKRSASRGTSCSKLASSSSSKPASDCPGARTSGGASTNAAPSKKRPPNGPCR
jgi:hypothetical protein